MSPRGAKGAGALQSRWFALPAGVIVATGGAALIALVVAGFILGGYLDAGGATIPGVGWLGHLPRLLRIAIEIVIGVPLAFGVALYAISQLLEFVMLVSWPFRKIFEALRSQP